MADSSDLGSLRWSIDVDDSLFNAKIDRAEGRVRALAGSARPVRIGSAIDEGTRIGSPGAGPGTGVAPSPIISAAGGSNLFAAPGAGIAPPPMISPAGGSNLFGAPGTGISPPAIASPAGGNAFTAAQRAQPNMLAAAMAAGAGAAPAAGAAGGGWGQRIPLRGMRYIGGVIAAEAAVGVAKGAIAAFNAYNEPNLERKAKFIQEGQEAVSNYLPFIGPAIVGLGELYSGAGQMLWNKAMGRGYHTDAALAQRTMDEVAEMESRNTRVRSRGEAAAATNSTAQKIIDADKISYSAEAAAQTAYDAADLKLAGPNATKKSMAALGILRRKIASGREEDQYREYQGVMAVGDAGYAVQQDQYIASVNGERAATASSVAVAGMAASAYGSRLRIAGQYGAAQEADINQGFDDKGAGIRDRYKAEIASAKVNGQATSGLEERQGKELAGVEAERSAQLAEAAAKRKRDAENSVTDANASANAARLRANRDFYAADLAEFDRAADAKIKSMFGATPEAISAEKGNLNAQRGALIAGQDASKQGMVSGYGNRQRVAAASGQGFGHLAGFLGLVGGMEQARIAAPAGERGILADTQRAELQAIEKNTLRPNRYATETSRGTEKAGGPGGNAGREMILLLQAIRDAIKAVPQTIS